MDKKTSNTLTLTAHCNDEQGTPEKISFHLPHIKMDKNIICMRLENKTFIVNKKDFKKIFSLLKKEYKELYNDEFDPEYNDADYDFGVSGDSAGSYLGL